MPQVSFGCPSASGQSSSGDAGVVLNNLDMKQLNICEPKRFELRATALNIFNDVNFLLGAAGNDVNTLSYRDITVSGANDPGGRIIEFQLRFVI